MIIDHVLHHLPLPPPPPGRPPLASDALLGPGHKKFDQTVAKKHKAVSTKYNLYVAKNPPPTFPSSSRTIWSNGGFCTTSNYLNRYLMLSVIVSVDLMRMVVMLVVQDNHFDRYHDHCDNDCDDNYDDNDYGGNNDDDNDDAVK